MNTDAITQIEAEQRSFIVKVYAWMSLALVVTGFVAILTASSPLLIDIIFGSRIFFWFLLIGQILMVAYLVGAVEKMSVSTAILTFIAYVGVLVFIGLTAYDTQKIKQMNAIGNEGTDEDKKESIMGALTLYLDFINLFLRLLQIFGRRK